ncbi:MAG: hypothetical protein IJU70_07860 [Lentisphaeria bacterium]|nr:hypothetical protein [Lentisphaeria bacterium]
MKKIPQSPRTAPAATPVCRRGSGLSALLFMAVILAPGAEGQVWNRSNGFRGWKYAERAKMTVADGILRLTEIRSDCRIINRNLDIDPALCNTFTFTYRTTGGDRSKGELFFNHPGEKFSDSRRWDTPPLTGDGRWHTVSVMPDDLTSWLAGAKITALRFDPTNSAGPPVEIAEMRLEKRTREKRELVEKLDAPAWPQVQPELWKKGRIPGHGKKPYFKGKMIRSVEDKRAGKAFSTFYLRRCFTLKARPEQAFLQFTADDGAEVFINGSAAGRADDWRTCVTLDVKKHLTSGKNVLALRYVNRDSFGGVLAELYVQYADGSCERIDTDNDFRCGSSPVSGWDLPDFDDSGWSRAVEQEPPPAPPWRKILSYRRFSNLQTVLSAGVFPEKIPAGQPVRVRLVCRGRIPENALSADVQLRKGKDVLLYDKLTLDKKHFVPGRDGTWTLDFPYETPRFLKPDKFTISIGTDILSAQSETWKKLTFETTAIPYDPSFPRETVCRVAEGNGSPHFELNGKPLFLSWLCVPWNFVPMALPVNAVTVGAPVRALWPRDMEFNTDAFDLSAEIMRRRFPDARFIWNIFLVLPPDWPGKHPEEMCRREDGKIADFGKGGYPSHSYSSPTARKQFEEIIEKSIRYLENSPYANRIIGYRLSGGYTAEWLGWEPRGSALDFSDCAKKAYAEFVEKKYPGADTAVPKKTARVNRDKEVLWDQRKYRRAIAYQEFMSRQNMDLLLALCRKAREILGPDKVLGTYYGYTSTLHHPGNSQRRAYYELKRLLSAGTVDFLMSPNSYVLRNLGETCGEMKPFATLLNHKIIPVCEDDTRTHNSYDVTWRAGSNTQTMTEKQSIAVERRNMGIALCRSGTNYFFPLVGGSSVSFPAMKREIAVMRTVGQHCLDTGAKRRAEIALVVSEESIKAMPDLGSITVPSGIIDQFYKADGTVRRVPRIRNVVNFETFVGNQDRFTRSGAIVDQLLAEDLADDPGNYKLYVFLNCYKFDEKFRRTAEKLRKRDCVLLWLYAPGYMKGLENSVSRMRELTGMSFEKTASGVSASVRLADGRIMGSAAAKVTPMFTVSDAGAEVLGVYDNGETGLAAVRTGKALSVFSGAWQLDLPFISEMLRRAKVFRCTETDDPVEACDRLVVLHARRPGKKRISLPRKSCVLDVFAGKIIARNASSFESDFDLHETKWFYCGEDAEELLQKLSKITDEGKSR